MVLKRFLILPILILAACDSEAPAPKAEYNPANYEAWSSYQGDDARSQFSSLSEITPENVSDLEVAWRYASGDAAANNRSQIQCNPIIVDGTLYATTPAVKVFALDAATGEEKWLFNPGESASAMGVNRGVVYWTDGSEERILVAAGHFLWALDAKTGEPATEFGDEGRVNLKEGLGRDASELFVGSNTPGAIYKDLLIVGTRVHEGPGPAAPGSIRAYNVRTGALVWTFRTIPKEGEFGYDTWPENAHEIVGGANSWAGMTLDTENGIVFIPTGSPSFDFWGGDRPGKNLFGTTILALDASTGKRKWHFQVVSHDLWDRDLPAPPNLATIERDGKQIDVVAQITKSGHVFILDRETGESIYPLEERDYPPSDLKGEEAWPTQVLPTIPPPFARQRFDEGDITDISPEATAFITERFAQVRSGGQFVPPSTQGTMIFPGFDGGGEWGGAAVDPRSGMMYVNSNEMPWILTMVDLSEQTTLGRSVYNTVCANCHGTGRNGGGQFNSPSLQGIGERLSRSEISMVITAGIGQMPSFAQLPEDELDALVAFVMEEEEPEGSVVNSTEKPPYGHTGYNRFVDQEGYPAVKPPWGTLNAINLNAGTIEWSVTLGEFDELTARGIEPTGTENYGGPAITATGVLFIGASKDEKFRAFRSSDGELLWETSLPAGGYATPSIYEADGRQFVVIAAGGGKMGTKSGDSYVAYALP